MIKHKRICQAQKSLWIEETEFGEAKLAKKFQDRVPEGRELQKKLWKSAKHSWVAPKILAEYKLLTETKKAAWEMKQVAYPSTSQATLYFPTSLTSKTHNA